MAFPGRPDLVKQARRPERRGWRLYTPFMLAFSSNFVLDIISHVFVVTGCAC